MLTEAITGVECFRVEVSGWDEEGVFFVEQSHLAWDEFAGKYISLRQMLPDGVIVFIPMLQPMAMRPSPSPTASSSSAANRTDCISFVCALFSPATVPFLRRSIEDHSLPNRHNHPN